MDAVYEKHEAFGRQSPFGQAGSKTEIVFDENGREVTLIEDTTLVEIGKSTSARKKARFNATYTADGMINHMENYLEEKDEKESQSFGLNLCSSAINCHTN